MTQVCPRCKGFMTSITLYDHEAFLEERWYSTDHCVNCSYTNFSPPRKEVFYGQETNSHAHARQERKERLLSQIMTLAFPCLTRRRIP